MMIVGAWARIASDMPKQALADMSKVIHLSDLPEAGAAILKGRSKVVSLWMLLIASQISSAFR